MELFIALMIVAVVFVGAQTVDNVNTYKASRRVHEETKTRTRAQIARAEKSKHHPHA